MIRCICQAVIVISAAVPRPSTLAAIARGLRAQQVVRCARLLELINLRLGWCLRVRRQVLPAACCLLPLCACWARIAASCARCTLYPVPPSCARTAIRAFSCTMGSGGLHPSAGGKHRRHELAHLPARALHQARQVPVPLEAAEVSQSVSQSVGK